MQFGARGFANTGVRDIAAEASVNPALVLRYYGSKEGLFRAALDHSIFMDPVFALEPGTMGQRIVEIFLAANEMPSPLSMMILSAGDPTAHAISVRALDEKVIRPLADYLDGPDAEARAACLNLLWSGFLTAWKLLPIAPLSDDRLPMIAGWLADATQAIVDGKFGPKGSPSAP
ncbi:TetR/AcrR family transcriptional regulator [Sphingomonas crocodyli]|uniref:TetR/AcrR family transcriptional regulator n=2 Tax=Sphingomonas crocodyli TaxID=1979270 RepID=A0A437LVP1_9SPHN|nr:TetR/AcrR family transcriptional regulator [Sphingomonas crocodyli]